MPPRLITDCTFDELEGALQIRYGAKLKRKEAGQTFRKYTIGWLYKLRADLHRGSHLQVVLKFRVWLLVLIAVVILWGFAAAIVPGIVVALVVFAWFLPRKTKKLAAELEESVRTKQEQDKRVVREEPSVIVKSAEPVVESEVVVRRADPEVAMKHCIKCGNRIRADAKTCEHCGATLDP